MDYAHKLDLLEGKEQLFSDTLKLFLTHSRKLGWFHVLVEIRAKKLEADDIVLSKSKMALHPYNTELVCWVFMLEKLEPLTLLNGVGDGASWRFRYF